MVIKMKRFVYFGRNSGNVYEVSDAETIEKAWDKFKKMAIRMDAGDASDASYEKAEVTKEDGFWLVFVDGSYEGEWVVIDLQSNNPKIQKYIEEYGVIKYVEEFVAEQKG